MTHRLSCSNPLLPGALILLALTAAALRPAHAAEPGEARRPNVLFIALDDLNDWTGALGGHPQAKTPNLDRLAASGVLFTNAHCPAPACNPSRSAVFTGISPHVSGLYANGQDMRRVLPDAELIPKFFSRHGYWSAGSGKMLHYFTDARSWDEYYPPKETENPFPPTMDFGARPKSLPRGGPWQYVETDWHAFDVTDDAFGGDAKVADYIAGKLARAHEQPFFLACGIYRPHEPWFVPKRYFDLFPLADLQLPPGYRADDLDDLPEAGQRAGRNRYFAHIREHGQWERGVQAYLASIAYADAMLGRVLDALDSGPHRDDTIVVLWSDHGWHLGEKEHWQKFTMWRACTRVPLIVRVPEGAPGLPAGTAPGGVCERPVNLLSLYRTLAELCGLADEEGAHGRPGAGPSLVPLLADPGARWDHVSLTFHHRPGTYAVSGERWRYIRYAEGGEELYDIESDPYEWDNLAGRPEHRGELERLRSHAPAGFAPAVATDASLPEIALRPGAGPPSAPDGNPFDLLFDNRGDRPVEIFWNARDGSAKSYGELAPGAQRKQQTRPGAVWHLRPVGGAEVIGHFAVGDRAARAVVR